MMFMQEQGQNITPELVKGEIPEDIIWNTIKLIKRTCVFLREVDLL